MIFKLRPEKQEGTAKQRAGRRHASAKDPPWQPVRHIERNRKKARMAGVQRKSIE